MNFPTLTNNQKLVAGAGLSLATSAVSTALAAAEQAYTTGHTLNVGVLIVVGLTTFGAAFSAALYSYVPGHITTEIAALKDTVADLTAMMHPVPPAAVQPRAITLPSGKQFIPGVPASPGNGAPTPPAQANTTPPPTNG